MPVYLCNAAAGTINNSAKAKIASDITHIHCDITGAPPVFVHAFFLENAPHMPLGGSSAVLRGSIRKGRTPAQKQEIADRISQSIRTHTGLGEAAVTVEIVDTPASWVMEGGEIFP